MKRLLCVALVLCLALPWGGVFAAEGEEQEFVPVEHLLWDIPFGIGMEEYKALVRERVGGELVEEERHRPRNSYVTFSSPSGDIRIWDYPVTLEAAFSGGERLSCIYADLLKDESTVPPEELDRFMAEAKQLLLDLLEKAEQDFGQADGGIVVMITDDPGSQVPNKIYSLPTKDGVLDKPVLEEICSEDVSFSLLLYYNTVEVIIRLRKSEIWTGNFDVSFEAYVSYSPIDLFAQMPSQDGEWVRRDEPKRQDEFVEEEGGHG